MYRDKSMASEPALARVNCAGRLVKPTTASFFRHSQRHKAKSQGIDPNDEKQMLQSMYLAAIEPMFSPTAPYRRAVMDKNVWENVYIKLGTSQLGFPYWYRSEVSESLVQYWDSIAHRLGVTDSLTRQSFYVLVPMCGSTRDLVWLYRQGVFVTGVDFSENALRTLCENNPDLDLQISRAHDDVYVARTRDHRLRIFACNFFTCPIYLDHQYNFVWDRCAFSCLNVEHRKAYVRQLMHCRAENFHMLIETFEYDPVLFSLPPHPAFPAEIQELLGSHLRTENVSRTVANVDWKAAARKELYQDFFDRQTLPMDSEPLTVTLQVTLLCNEH